MQLILTPDSGEPVVVQIQPDGEATAIVSDQLPPMGVRLIPDCEEGDLEHRDDHDGPIRHYTVRQGAESYGKGAGERVFLCLNHGRQARRRGEVWAL